MSKIVLLFFSVLFLGTTILADDSTFVVGKDVVITPTGYGSFEAGQVISGVFRTRGKTAFNIDHIWQERALCNIGLIATVKNRLDINLAGEGMIAFSTPQIASESPTLAKRDFFYIKRAFTSVRFGNVDNPFLKLHVGYFPFKYNPDVRNLGEYMFRSAAYPPIVYADFDYAQANLLGARVELNLFNKMIHNDLLFHSELYGIPTQDFSLSDVLNVNFRDIVNVGLGASLNHWFSVYQGNYDRDNTSNWAETYFYNPTRGPDDLQIVYEGDTINYSWRTVKAMARLSFDPKKIIAIPLFGENDLRLYFEVDVLGIKDIRALNYKFQEDRTIFTGGFNFPGFKIIDLVNLEMEFCSNTRYIYNEQSYYGGRAPSPMPQELKDGSDGLTPTGYSVNPWKWSIYIKKTFFGEHLGLIAQIARDHKKINSYYSSTAYQANNMSFDETLPNGNNWWWAFKTEFKF
jgi:hypothetical protein